MALRRFLNRRKKNEEERTIRRKKEEKKRFSDVWEQIRPEGMKDLKGEGAEGGE